MQKIIRHFKDLGYTVIAYPEEYFVKYDIYEIDCEDSDGAPNFHKAGSPIHPDPVKNIEDAEKYLNGDVKWDGCSNWFFDEQERGMLHGCDRNDLLNIGKIMASCWDLTKELCPKWDGE